MSLFVSGYTETSVWGGRDERGVRRDSIITGEGGYGCDLLRMAPQLLQPLPGLTAKKKKKKKKKQLVPLCRLPFHKAAKRSTRDALPRYSTPERGRRPLPRRIWEAEGESYEWVELGVELISICVRNYFL